MAQVKQQIKKKKKSPAKKINKVLVLTVKVIVLTLFIGVVFVYIPFNNKVKDLRADILKERDRNILIGKIRAFGKHLKVYEERIPENKGVSWLINTVSDIASKQQIEISSIKPGTPENRQLYTKLYVVLDTVSDYEKLGKFVSKIESSKKFLRIENAAIKRLDLSENFDEETSKYEGFDAKGHFVISTFVLRD